MTKTLPTRANLEHLKTQAKDLLAAARRGEAAAIARFRDSLPAARAHDAKIDPTTFALHDAQSVIAREYGFSSFAALRAHVTAPLEPLGPAALRALLAPHVGVTLPREIEDAIVAAAGSAPEGVLPVSGSLPLLAVRNAVLVVGSVAPINIGRPATIAAVDAARRGGGALAVFAQKNDTIEAPASTDLHAVGCVARLLSTVSTPDRGTWIVVRAEAWVRLAAMDAAGDYPRVEVTPFEVDEAELTDEAATLVSTLRERIRPFAEASPARDAILAMTERLSPAELADATVANIPCSVQEKARYAATTALEARLRAALELLPKME